MAYGDNTYEDFPARFMFVLGSGLQIKLARMMDAVMVCRKRVHWKYLWLSEKSSGRMHWLL